MTIKVQHQSTITKLNYVAYNGNRKRFGVFVLGATTHA